MRTAGTVSSAGGIHQRAAEGFGRNQSLEIERFRGDHALRTPGLTSIHRAVEGDSSVAIVAPGDIKLAVRTHEGDSADTRAGSAPLIRGGNAECRPMIPIGATPDCHTVRTP